MDSTTQFDNKDLEGVKLVTMDRWEPYIQVTKQYVPHTEQRIAFDKFHADRAPRRCGGQGTARGASRVATRW